MSGSSVSAGAGDLEAEWESFEKLISGTSDEPAPSGSALEPIGVPCPPCPAFPTSFSPPLANNSKSTGADLYERSLQNLYSNDNYEPEELELSQPTRKSSDSTHDSDSDMDICSNSSSQEKWMKRSPQSRRPTTSSISSSAILAANEAIHSDLESGSESGKSDQSSLKEKSRKRFSESDGSDEGKDEHKTFIII